jgi:tetratricopeptide (TPR) repeat protein
MAGPGIKKGEKIYGANLLDIAPTVLNLLGLPAGEDMDGKPMAHVIGEQWWHPPKMISSWEDVPGEAGMHPKGEQQDPFATREALRQLVELGYIQEPDENEEKAARDASREANYNLARAYQDGGLLEKAAGHLEKLYRDSPEQTRFGLDLSRVYLKQGRFEETRSVAEGLLTMIEKRNLIKIKQLNEALRKIDEQPEEVIATVREKQEKRHRKQVDAEEAQTTKKKHEARNIEPLTFLKKEEFLAQRRGQLQKTVDILRHYNVRAAPTVCLLLGRLEAMDGNFKKALTYLGKAEQAEPRLPGLHLQLAQTYLRIRRNDEAIRACEKALEIDPDNAQAHEVLAAVLARLKRHEEAANHALSAVELIHNMPRAHLRLGATLTRLGLYEKAVEAFQTCLKLAPNTPTAHRYLAMIYRTKLGRRDLASTHSFKLKMLQDQKRTGRNPAAKPENSPSSHPKPTVNTVAISSEPGLLVDPSEVITIVTGLPRSGTSMMMQMLVAGGLPPLTDGIREADISNPRGYYEYDKAKQLGSDADWISEGKGKVVKIVAQLLPLLPRKIDGAPAHYRIVFMERALEEVVSSQRVMLDRQQRKGAALDQTRLAEIFFGQIQKIQTVITDRGIPCIRVQHAEAIRDPLSVANQLNRFFDKSLDTTALAAAVDPTLYREQGKD